MNKQIRLIRIVTAIAAATAAFAAWRFDAAPLLRAQAAPAASAPAVASAQEARKVPAISPTAPGALAASEPSSWSTISDVSERAVQSVVNISTTRMVRHETEQEGWLFRRPPAGSRGDNVQREHSLGSGVLIGAQGLVLTNNHVIEGASAIQVKLADGREFAGKLVGADKRSDVAVLQLEGNPTGLLPLPLADSDKLRLGEVVLAIGSPLGLAQSVSMGIVSAKGRADVHIADYEDFIQTDAAINPGNSGGALVNLHGELVGINTAIASMSGGNQGIGFAIPSNMARTVMDSLVKSGHFTRGWLGVGIQDLTIDLRKEFSPSLAAGGVLVTSVEIGSPADKAGLKRGDVVTRIGDQAMDSPRRLRNCVGMHPPGAALALAIVRENKALQVTVTLAEAPDAGVARTSLGAGLDGLSVRPLDRDLRQRFGVGSQVPAGVAVTEVAPDSPAAASGLQVGDIILEVNRRPLSDVNDFQKALKSGKAALLLVYRDGGAFFLAIR